MKLCVVSLFILFSSFWLTLLYFRPDLALDTERAAEGGAHVSTGASLDVVSVPGLAAQQEGRHAGEEAAEYAAEEAGLVQVLRVPVHEAGLAASAAHADAAVTAAVDQALVPSASHFCVL